MEALAPLAGSVDGGHQGIWSKTHVKITYTGLESYDRRCCCHNGLGGLFVVTRVRDMYWMDECSISTKDGAL